jgi:hypothetical protein
MAWVTASEILVQAGAPTPPSVPDTEWAEVCAEAVSTGLDARLSDVEVDPLNAELHWVALESGVEAYKRREAVFGVTGYSDLQGVAIRVARDYLDSYAPIITRYTTPGIG